MAGSLRCSAVEGDHRASGVEEPGERLTVFSDRLGGSQVALDIGDGALQHPQLVEQPVQLVPGDDQLGLAETELLGPVSGLVVPLAAGAAAEAARSARAGRDGEPPTTPGTATFGAIGHRGQRTAATWCQGWISSQ